MGNQIQVSDAERAPQGGYRLGRVREFNYDALNRLTEEEWLDGSGNPIRTITTTYDNADQLIEISDPDSNYSFVYDLLGRLVTVDNAGTPGMPNVVLDYSYDANGNRLSMSEVINGTAGATTNYSYDELNRVNQIIQTGNNVADKRVDFAYNNLGQYESITRYADLAGSQLVIESSYNYDDANRLENLLHNNNNSAVAFYAFEYDFASRITQIINMDGSTDYNYDDINQLTSANHSAVTNPDEAYSYDANGNRITSSQHGNGYETGLNNRLESDGQYNYEYDAEGNLIRQVEIATGNVREFEYDYWNRLVAIIDKDFNGVETQEVEFTYDAMNRRIAKTVDTTPTDAVDGVVTYFVYDGDNVVLEFVDTDGVDGDELPVLEQRYLHGNAVDMVLAQENVGDDVVWLLSDHLGTTRDIVNNDGTLVNHIVYDSYGNIVSETDSNVDTLYLYTGREFDSETGLQYNRARYYDAEIGRFISEDPIGFVSRDGNLYRYVENSPINWSDPSGKCKITIYYRGLHADIVVTDIDETSVYFARAKNLEPFGNDGFGNIIVRILEKGETHVANISHLYHAQQTVYKSPNCNEPCPEIENKIKTTLERIEQANVPYDPLFMNSNSAAFTALEYALGKRDIPKVNAPGWHNNPLDYRPTLNIPDGLMPPFYIP